jgi:hypothetical protein
LIKTLWPSSRIKFFHDHPALLGIFAPELGKESFIH